MNDALAAELATADPRPESDAPRNALERRLLPLLRDPRDLAFVRLLRRAALHLLPAIALLFALPGWLALLLAPAYLNLLYLRFGGPLMLMAHAVTHRRSFHRGGAWIDGLIRQGVPLVFGIAPWSYAAHHIVMHHAAGNRADDISSTLAYRRDSPAGFARYLLRFLLLGHVDMSRYLVRHRHWRMLRLMWAGEAGFWLAVALLWQLEPAATAVVLVAPWVLTRCFLMAGNWAQHAFIHPEAPDDDVRCSTVLLDSPHNARCFNDGYHALHHRQPGLHWADMAARFAADWRWYAERGVILFERVPNNQVVWWKLMRGDYAWLAARMRDTGHLPAAAAERIALLRERVRRRYPAAC